MHKMIGNRIEKKWLLPHTVQRKITEGLQNTASTSEHPYVLICRNWYLFHGFLNLHGLLCLVQNLSNSFFSMSIFSLYTGYQWLGTCEEYGRIGVIRPWYAHWRISTIRPWYADCPVYWKVKLGQIIWDLLSPF